MPSSSKRVFSNNQDNSFHDYLINKKGVEMVKNLKATSNKIKFLSYNDFTILTKAFSKNSNIIATDIETNRSMNDKTTGLIYYEKIVDHMRECSWCQENQNNSNSLIVCPAIKNIIYAYQNHFNNSSINIYQKKIDLDRWCKKCDESIFPYIEHETPIAIVPSVEKYKCPQDRIRGPGKGRNPIFCSQCDKFIDVCLCKNRWGRVDAIRHVNRQSAAETFEDRNKKPLFF